LFVIEIASRISYEYKGFYAHHILTEVQYDCPDISTILIRDLTDEEIEIDFLRMKELLSPKPFIVVTHICTRPSGKRYELVQLLRRLCTKHNIPLFNPYEETKEYSPEQLYVKEDVIAHYTQEGHTIIGKKYKTFIDTLKI